MSQSVQLDAHSIDTPRVAEPLSLDTLSISHSVFSILKIMLKLASRKMTIIIHFVWVLIIISLQEATADMSSSSGNTETSNRVVVPRSTLHSNPAAGGGSNLHLSSAGHQQHRTAINRNTSGVEGGLVMVATSSATTPSSRANSAEPFSNVSKPVPSFILVLIQFCLRKKCLTLSSFL